MKEEKRDKHGQTTYYEHTWEPQREFKLWKVTCAAGGLFVVSAEVSQSLNMDYWWTRPRGQVSSSHLCASQQLPRTLQRLHCPNYNLSSLCLFQHANILFLILSSGSLTFPFCKDWLGRPHTHTQVGVYLGPAQFIINSVFPSFTNLVYASTGISDHFSLCSFWITWKQP